MDTTPADNQCLNGMLNGDWLPLHVKVQKSRKAHRVYVCFHLAFLQWFLGYRLVDESQAHGMLWMTALCCEVWFGLEWILEHNMRWSQLEHLTFPERLALRYSEESTSKLPAVDIFVTTTDPYKESAIMTLNTVVSILAMDYPVDRMACYVSDDGASPITSYSLVEAFRFARKWVPFCKKYSIQTRAPFMYFSNQTDGTELQSPEFVREWSEMKSEYEDLETRINKALEAGEVPVDSARDGVDGFSYWRSDAVHRRNHSSILQIISENKNKGEVGREDDALPHLIYVAREKRPGCNHHYKAGALNVLARVSAVMTNAPFILNLDCDMHVNNPKAIQHALCFFLDCQSEQECGFVQFPQVFHGAPSDDPFGNQLKASFKGLCPGINGIQGPIYGGTGCFHRRKGLYGIPPVTEHNPKIYAEVKDSNTFWSSMPYEALKSKFGDSVAIVTSAYTIMMANTQHKITNIDPSFAIAEAFKVASCSYEINTAWGEEVGWMYGSTVEDVMTGLRLHSLGWRSVYCAPQRPAFMGTAPGNCPDTLVQQKRWACGLLEIFLSRLCPILGVHRKILFRQRMVYAYFNLWAIWSLPTLCYATLPAFCLLSGNSFLPKISERAFMVAAVLFVSVHGFKLLEYVRIDCSVREWWNNQRMWLIVSVSSWLFAVFEVLSKQFGLSETVFVVTPKQSEGEEGEDGEFTFDSSPLFIPPTALLFTNVIAIIAGATHHMVEGRYEIRNIPLAEYFCSVWIVINLWPFMKGLVRTGKRGIPWAIVIKSGALGLFYFLSVHVPNNFSYLC